MNASENATGLVAAVSRPALAFCLSIGLLTSVVGVVCNSCVIVTILKTRSLRKSSINRAVLNLCCADLITVCLDVPLSSFILLNNFDGNHKPLNDMVCHAQSFAHTIGNSVQVLAFPVIGLERLFSVTHPFDKGKQLHRVNLLNALSWLTGLIVASLAAFFFESTSMGIYCRPTWLNDPNTMQEIFVKIYVVTLPLGVSAILATAACYAFIVWYVRKQKLNSLAARQSCNFAADSSQNKRARSLSTPAAMVIANNVAIAPQRVQIRIDEAPHDPTEFGDCGGTREAVAMNHLTIPTSKLDYCRRASITSSGAALEVSLDTWTSIDFDQNHLHVPERPLRLSRSASAEGTRSLGLSKLNTDFHDYGNISGSLSRLPTLLKSKLGVSKSRVVHGKRRREAIMAQRSSYIVALFLIIWLPLPVIVGYSNYHVKNLAPEMIQKYLDLHVCAFCFGALSAATNPIVYALAIKSFRKSLSALMRLYRRKLAAQLTRQ